MLSNHGSHRDNSGFTLIEIVLGALTLVVAATAILGAYLGQGILNEHARNLSLAVQDANRVIEQIRLQNSPCAGTNPTISPPVGFTSWDAWLTGAGGLKSIQPTPATTELIVVTCQDRTGAEYCPANQMGAEWHAAGPNTPDNPIRVTVSVCWRQRNRTIGECGFNAGALTPNDALPMPADTLGVIDSPAMLTTLVTCRS